ncbi:MAG: ankyrin repeat domain-containing protein [Proteobacteria bacterium]|nr:ankyrin repeat domain-containing protein [Pseudomonadota bacterium]
MNFESPLFKACKDGNLALVRTLLQSGVNPNEGDEKTTPLNVAVRCGYFDITRILLKYGASPDSYTKELATKAQDQRIEIELNLYTTQCKPKDSRNSHYLSLVIDETHSYSSGWVPHVQRYIAEEPLSNLSGHKWSFGLSWKEIKNQEFINTLLDIFCVCPLSDLGNPEMDSFNSKTTKNGLIVFTRPLPLFNKPQHVLQDDEVWGGSTEFYSKNVAAVMNICLLAANDVPRFLGEQMLFTRSNFSFLGLADASITPFEGKGTITPVILENLKCSLSRIINKRAHISSAKKAA